MAKLRGHVIYNIFSSIPLSAVQSVLVEHPPSSPFWTKALGPLQELRYIKLTTDCIPNRASVLSPVLDNCAENGGEHTSQRSYQIFAPALGELEPDHIDFSPFDQLTVRKEEGRALGRLTITQCYIDEFDEQDMSDVAGELQWDGECSPMYIHT